jgi:hypothetical protein
MDTPDQQAEPELSPEQLQDLVVVAIPATQPEALYLCDALEDAEIPAVTQGDALYGLSGGPGGTRVCVPRVLLTKAKEVVDQARIAAKTRGVEQAFDPDNINDMLDDPRAHPALLRLARLRDAEPQLRRETLAKYATYWLERNVPAVDIAKCVAAAGMTQEEATAMIAELNSTLRNSVQAESTQDEASESPLSTEKAWALEEPLPEAKTNVIRSAETIGLGIEWLFYPWFFVARERLAFSLFEFWVTMIGCGVSMGLLVSRMAANNAPMWMHVLLSYAVLHTFLVTLLGGVYEARRRRLKYPQRRVNQILLVLLFEIPAIAAWVGVAMSIDMPFKR